MQPSPVLSLASSSSPSFNSYSNSSLADIAARVVEEFRAENENGSEFLDVGDLFCALENDIEQVGDLGKEDKAKGHLEQEDEEQNNDEEEFEFSFVPRDAEFSLISADQIFYNGQIRPVFPIFNRNLLLGDVESGNSVSNSLLTSSSGERQKVSATPQTIRLPLRKLLSEDRETPSSCSSSEADELDGIPEGTYCVWRPKAVKEEEASPGKCKKSNSTGSSKRWRLRDLVHRSNSDGKDTFVFLTPSFRKGEDNKKVAKPSATESSKTAGKSKPNLTAATHYTKNRGDKRRSYLPYRQDLVGFFANVNGVSRNLQPF